MLSGVQAGHDTRRMAKQAGSMGNEEGLGCHEEGVSEVDDGCEKASTPLLKRYQLAL